MTGPRKMDRDDAAAAWNALPRPLHWTKKTPTEPGWYFLRGNIPGYQENNPPVYVDVQKDADDVIVLPEQGGGHGGVHPAGQAQDQFWLHKYLHKWGEDGGRGGGTVPQSQAES